MSPGCFIILDFSSFIIQIQIQRNEVGLQRTDVLVTKLSDSIFIVGYSDFNIGVDLVISILFRIGFWLL